MDITQGDIIIAKVESMQKQLDKMSKEHKPNKKRVLSILELSKLYNIGGKRIKKAIEEGELCYITLNNRDISIYQGEFELWLDSLRRRKKTREVETYSNGEQLLKSSALLDAMADAKKRQKGGRYGVAK